MDLNKKLTDYTYTQIIPVLFVSDPSQLDAIADLQGQCRAQTYNKLGSLQGWGMNWRSADPIIRSRCPAQDQLPGKLREWAVNDCFKAISAGQEAAKVFIIREIKSRYPRTQNENRRSDWYREQIKLLGKKSKKADKENLWQQAQINFPADEIENRRNQLISLLETNPTGDSYLHGLFRKHYVPGHTFVRNQIVYQGQGYRAKRIKRTIILIEVQSLQRGKRIELLCSSQRIPTKQIRVIKNDRGEYEIHTTFSEKVIASQPSTKRIGLDKGYTEGFYSSENHVIAPKLGETLTKKTNRSNRINKNRHRLFQHSQKQTDPKKSARILECNLGSKTLNRKLNQSKATIKSMIRGDLYRYITDPTLIVAEDLSHPIPGKKMAKSLNRKLNQWMKGELLDSLIAIGHKTGSTVALVNCAYTSQVDSQTGTLLGSRKGDRFIRYTGDVLQSDYNAAVNIDSRYDDRRITLYMKSDAVRAVLLNDTVRYLHSIGETVSSAIEKDWLAKKFQSEAITIEASITHRGSGYVETKSAGSSESENAINQNSPVLGNQQQSSHEYVKEGTNSLAA